MRISILEVAANQTQLSPPGSSESNAEIPDGGGRQVDFTPGEPPPVSRKTIGAVRVAMEGGWLAAMFWLEPN